MGREQKEDQKLGNATTSKKLLVEEKQHSYIWHRVEENEQPQHDDDDDMPNRRITKTKLLHQNKQELHHLGILCFSS